MIIVDTGPLVAAANSDDHDHNRCVAMFRTARRPWLVPQPVIAEVCYLLERERGSHVEAAFLRSFGRREMTLAPLTIEDCIAGHHGTGQNPAAGQGSLRLPCVTIFIRRGRACCVHGMTIPFHDALNSLTKLVH